jgi:predicted RNase H-like nuclease
VSPLLGEILPPLCFRLFVYFVYFVVKTAASASEILLAGIDLAWGEKMSDGVCFAAYDPKRKKARLTGYAYPQGDDALAALIAARLAPLQPAFLAIDAPIVCPNLTGARPVDRLTHTLFHRQHAACHPANLSKCPRPPRVLARLAADLGFAAGWSGGPSDGSLLAAEVYPHPAMVRLFGLDRIIKYKKGPVAAKRAEFARLQGLIAALLEREFSYLALDTETPALLSEPWSKPVEDRTDALFCALIALHHVRHAGARSEVIGDAASGFILLPAS